MQLASPDQTKSLKPPPVPASPVADASFLDQMGDDVRKLARDINEVMSHRPGRSNGAAAGAVRAANPVEARMFTEAEWGGAVPDWLHDEAHSKIGVPPPASADRAAGWVRRAKRQRIADRLHLAMSWMVTLGLGTAIIGSSAYLLLGRIPGSQDVMALGRTFW